MKGLKTGLENGWIIIHLFPNPQKENKMRIKTALAALFTPALFFVGCAAPGNPLVVARSQVLGCKLIEKAPAKYDVSVDHSASFNLTGSSSQTQFCYTYKADPKTISAIVQGIVPMLGNPMTLNDPANGVFTTGEMQRGSFLLVWKDSYSINVQQAPDSTDQTVVRVLRVVTKQDGDKFFPSPSDGFNESWILAQIDQKLAARK
jgi:hypothetical protein